MHDTTVKMILKFISEIYGGCDGVAWIECGGRDQCQLCLYDNETKNILEAGVEFLCYLAIKFWRHCTVKLGIEHGWTRK
jgi:hypothetical protein